MSLFCAAVEVIRDLDECGHGELTGHDVCIVGTGPAGTTIAEELRGLGFRVCVLESGLERPTARGDALRRVFSEGIYVKDSSRERVLGGASTTWAGGAAPLDGIDYEIRPHVAHSGWPITREEVTGYLVQASERYRFAPLAFFEPDGFVTRKQDGALQPAWTVLKEKPFLTASGPQDFGLEWRSTFEGEDVDLWLDATIVRMEVDQTGGRVEAVIARTRSGREVTIRSRAFVLATGGIENARILLCSDDGRGGALGNEHDQVGRYLMNHPKFARGIVALKHPVKSLPSYFGCAYRGFDGRTGLRLPPALQREFGVLNCYLRLEPLFPSSDNAGVVALEHLLRRIKRSRGRGNAEIDDGVAPRGHSEGNDDDQLRAQESAPSRGRSLMTILVHLPRVVHHVSWRVYCRFTHAKPSMRRLRVRNYLEMEPHPENCVVLSDERDANGERIPLVRHRTTALDRRSLVMLHVELARELERLGIGRLENSLEHADPWPVELDASHHMGTTRMGTDPRTSVVNTDCRLHSVDNVYLAGSSVFPTSGCTAPTFTIVALAIRLASHLNATLVAGDRGDHGELR